MTHDINEVRERLEKDVAGPLTTYTVVCAREDLRALLADHAQLQAVSQALLEALEEAVACGMVPVSSVREGGAVGYSRQVRCADMIRAAIAKAVQP